jgi:hypothetical protein
MPFFAFSAGTPEVTVATIMSYEPSPWSHSASVRFGPTAPSALVP